MDTHCLPTHEDQLADAETDAHALGELIATHALEANPRLGLGALIQLVTDEVRKRGYDTGVAAHASAGARARFWALIQHSQYSDPRPR